MYVRVKERVSERAGAGECYICVRQRQREAGEKRDHKEREGGGEQGEKRENEEKYI